MRKKLHVIKCKTDYFQARERGKKLFEVRKNDRDYRIGDDVCLLEIAGGGRTGRQINFTITYIMYGGIFGIDKDYCIFN